ncbi:hypothetical protein [Micromonospora sp. NPDC047134]|uniref:hypothetical protein n=1 Tax=Micromonospora sp. NPDC047134 TaxID=3154340 RepID=UPI0033DF490F
MGTSFEDALAAARAEKVHEDRKEVEAKAREMAIEIAWNRDLQAATAGARKLVADVEAAIAALRGFAPGGKTFYLGASEYLPNVYGHGSWPSKPRLTSFGILWSKAFVVDGWQIGEIRVPLVGDATIMVRGDNALGAAWGPNWNSRNVREMPLREFMACGGYRHYKPVFDYDARTPSGSKEIRTLADKVAAEFITQAATTVAEFERRARKGEPLYQPRSR